MHLDLVARRKITVPAFAGEGVMPKAVPIKSGDAESGARGDHGAVAFGILGSSLRVTKSLDSSASMP